MSIWGIIAWIIFGGLAGYIASLIVRTAPDQGATGNVIIGIVGAIIGGWLMQAFGSSGVTGFNAYSLLVAILGAVVLLAIVNLFRRGGAKV
jgi:uncharacterized membrane protein YeaQ/YmgE (transglycosylase-associated protein family)